jgi:hypothetical protein
MTLAAEGKRVVSSNITCWLNYCNRLEWRARTASRSGTLDRSSFLALVRARSLVVPMGDALLQIAERISAAGGSPDASKLARQASDAYGQTVAKAPCAGAPVSPRVKCVKSKLANIPYEPEALRRLAERLSFQVTPEWLYERSPLHPNAQTPGRYFRLLLRPGEKGIVFTKFASQGEVWQYDTPGGDSHDLDYLQEGHIGVWFLINPVDGQWRTIDRLKSKKNPTGRSRRAEENIVAWRYAAIETDDAPQDLWLNALAQLPLPIFSITESGNSSGAHAIVVINGESKPHWDAVVREGIGPGLVKLGADFSTLRDVQLSRMPNCCRGQTGRMQQLLYLNPEPDGTPICERPVLWNGDAVGEGSV